MSTYATQPAQTQYGPPQRSFAGPIVLIAIGVGSVLGHFYPEAGTALKPLGDGRFEALVHPGGKLKPGRVVHVSAELDVEILEVTERRSRVVREHEDRHVIRRLFAPPPSPALVRPRAADGPEHVAAEDPGADPGEAPCRHLVVHVRFAALFALHPAPRPGREDPVEELQTADPERVLEVLVRPGAVAVERHGEALDAHSWHGGLSPRVAQSGEKKDVDELRLEGGRHLVVQAPDRAPAGTEPHVGLDRGEVDRMLAELAKTPCAHEPTPVVLVRGRVDDPGSENVRFLKVHRLSCALGSEREAVGLASGAPSVQARCHREDDSLIQMADSIDLNTHTGVYLIRVIGKTTSGSRRMLHPERGLRLKT